ncbi:hypothetical protein MCOR25_001195 [Pyricularia grisea]|nr:hypothetical protein MCOR25_001195 [Pyricularia grisea]
MLFSVLFSLWFLDPRGLLVLGTFIALAFSPTSAQDEEGCWFREDPNSAGDDIVFTPLVDNWAPSSLCFPGIDEFPTRTSASLSTLRTSSVTVTVSITSLTTSTALTTSVAITTTTTTTTTTITDIVVETQTPYIRTILRHHNAHRANHSAPSLVWSESLAGTAQSIAETCIFQHNTTADGGGYGQNIVAGAPADQMGVAVTNTFYNPEVAHYTWYGSEPDLTDFVRWGHFSQLIWTSTAEVGCATVDCSSHPGGLQNAQGQPSYFTVCNYKPPGNYIGIFAPNMSAPLGFPSIDGTFVCGSNINC